MHYYDRHIGDYSKDTGHLSLVEHGAYTMLLDWAYSSERPLPKTDLEIFRLCRAQSQKEKEAVRKVVSEFFPEVDGIRRNKRVMQEIGGFKALSAQNSAAANIGWSKRKQTARNAPAMRPHREDHAPALPSQCQPVTSNHEPVTIERERGGASGVEEDGPPTKVSLEMARSWLDYALEQGADISADEVEQAWRDYHATRLPDGTWRHRVTSRTPLTDWRYGLEDQIQHNRQAFPSRAGADTSRREPGSEKNREKSGAVEGMSPAQARFKWGKELEELEAQAESAHALDQPPDAGKTQRARELREKLKGLTV